MDVVLAVGGVLLGFLLSFLLWWLLSHFFVPEISFASGISKLPYKDGEQVAYRIKIENSGRRDIIDLSCRVRLYLPRVNFLRPYAKRNTKMIEIPLNTQHIFVLRSGSNRIFTLELGAIRTKFLPSDVSARACSERDGALEALFDLGHDAYLLIQILAYDSFSGARKYYRSGKYASSDVKLGYFKDLDVVADQRLQPQR